MSQGHWTLIYIAAETVSGIPVLSEMIKHIKPLGQVLGLSSIYKRYLNSRQEDLNSEICAVLLVNTDRSDEDLSGLLKTLNQQRGQGSAQSTTRAVLLSYDNEVKLFPQRPLPHPQLHEDQVTLRCASEVWGSFEHPVLGQTLNELVRSEHGMSRAEFFAQGNQILGDL